MGLANFLDKTAALKRPSVTKDAIGASSRAYDTAGDPFPVAVWPTSSGIARTFARRDIVGDTVIVSDADRGARASDIIVVGALTYLVNGAQPFANAALGGQTVYVIDATLRTV